MTSQLLPAILFGGLPFVIGAIFWFFPHKLSAVFMSTGGPWPKLNERIYSPKAMKVCGVLWAIFGIVMWADILLGKS